MDHSESAIANDRRVLLVRRVRPLLRLDRQEHRRRCAARFDSPSSALAFAAELRQALDTVGLQIRCGLHTGEIELRDNGDIAGLAVNLAARVEQACDDGAIFVSSTVCDLLLGGDARFDDRGEYQLKGFDRLRRLFSVATGA